MMHYNGIIHDYDGSCKAFLVFVVVCHMGIFATDSQNERNMIDNLAANM
jgi:hypothetical protein